MKLYMLTTIKNDLGRKDLRRTTTSYEKCIPSFP